MNLLKKITVSFLLVLGIFITGCKKVEGPLTDLRPATPIIISNAIAFRPEPTVSVSRSAIGAGGVVGPFEIVLTIPESSPRTFKSITKVAAPGVVSYSRIQSTSTIGVFNTAPIPASGKSATFRTSLTEYLAKTPSETNPLVPAGTISASNTELGRRFYFLITLDDGTEIIPEPVRVLVFD